MATELDYMEYANDAAAQAAYVSSDTGAQGLSAQTVDTHTGGFSGFNIRQLIDASKLSGNATRVRVTLKGSPSGENTKCAKVYIGHAAAAGDPYDYDGNQAEVLFGGTSGVTIAQGATETSDWTTFSLDDTKNLIVAVYLDDGNQDDFGYNASIAGFTRYFKVTPDETGTTDVTGYTETATRLDLVQSIIGDSLQCFSEDTIIQQGTYSLRGIAVITDSLNDTLTRTVDPTIDLSELGSIYLYLRASRTGSNIKIGFRDSGTTTTEVTPNIISANAWQAVALDISGVTDANKDVIDRIIVTIVNADADNTFYIDNIYAELAVNAVFFGCNF